MDNRFESADWLVVSGGLLLLLSSKLAWWSVAWATGQETSTDAFDYTMTGLVPLVVLVGVGVITVIVKTDSLPLPAWVVHPYLVAAAVIVAAGLVGIRFFRSGYEDVEGVSRGLGLYLAAAAVVIALIGAGQGIRARRRPSSDDATADDDLDDEDDPFPAADEEDDLVRRFNASMPAAPVERAGRSVTPPRRAPVRRQPTPRGDVERPASPSRSRRRPSDPPLP